MERPGWNHFTVRDGSGRHMEDCPGCEIDTLRARVAELEGLISKRTEEDRRAIAFFQHVSFMDYLNPNCTTVPPAPVEAEALRRIFMARLYGKTPDDWA